MVTRLQAVTKIKRRLSFRTNLEDDIVLEIIEAQNRFQRGHSLPWFLKQEDQTLSFVEGTASVALPSDFLRECEDQSPSWRLSDEDYPFFPEKKDWEDAFDAYAIAEDGLAQVYVIRKTTFHVFPTPDRNYDITWGYYGADTELLSDSSTNQWLTHAPSLLIGAAGSILAQDTQNPEALSAFQAMMTTAWAELFAEGVEREDANRNYRLGAGL